ncbi:MAG: hypothetical protein IH624_17370 [Phycisphaerae bacterium]|nr:hypothetical protein [Phycisphaerae bacterium]
MIAGATRAVVDGSVVFVQLALEVGTWTRQTVERTAAGLDGVVSVDLGRRSRSLVQRGQLRAFSEAGLRAQLCDVCGLADGQVHTLLVSDGQLFADVRVDGVYVSERVTGGGGVRCEFEMRYTQLGQ